MRAPDALRFVLVTRHDLRLGLHRLRLEGDLTEIRAADLRFTLEEARQLFRAAGVEQSDAAVMRLHERTEGWAEERSRQAIELAEQHGWTDDPARLRDLTSPQVGRVGLEPTTGGL